MDLFVEGVEKINVGDGFDPKVDMGPLQNEGAVSKVEYQIADAIEKGGSLVVGGERINSFKGHFLSPAVLVNSSDDMLIMREETFGPVAAFKTAIVVKRLPKTRSGKILRGTVRKIADSEEYKMPATIDDPAILDEIKQDLINNNILK